MVVAGLDPGAEQPVQLLQRGQLVIGDLDQELGSDRGEEPFDLATSFRPTGPGVHELDPEHRTDALQLVGHERAAVIDIDPLRNPTRRQATT
jgi:hypothetical protein